MFSKIVTVLIFWTFKFCGTFYYADVCHSESEMLLANKTKRLGSIEKDAAEIKKLIQT